jgi:hypothetical protein
LPASAAARSNITTDMAIELFGAAPDAEIMSLRSQLRRSARLDIDAKLRLSRNTGLVVRILQELS